jgi:hypothetical protein
VEKEFNPAFQSNSFELGILGLEFILNFGFCTLDFINLYGITNMIREIFELSLDGYRGDLMRS